MKDQELVSGFGERSEPQDPEIRLLILVRPLGTGTTGAKRVQPRTKSMDCNCEDK